MRIPLLMGLVLGYCMLVPMATLGQGVVSISINHPVVAGQPTGLTIRSIDDWGAGCPSEHSFWQMAVDWGDGFTSTYGGDQGDPGHVYKGPGRYLIRARYDACVRGPGCQICVTENAEFWIDVQPDPVATAGGWLGTFFDTQAKVCTASVTSGVTKLYVVAGLLGQSAVGIAGAEFRLVNSNPNGFVLTATAMPGWIMVGDPLGAGAALVRDCAMNQGAGRVPLLEVTVFANDGAVNGHLIVQQASQPTNPLYTAPTLILCDTPTHSAIAAGNGYAALMNPSSGADETTCPDLPVAVEQQTWSRIKQLYR